MWPYPDRVSDGLAPGQVAGTQHPLPGLQPHPLFQGLAQGVGEPRGQVIGEGEEGCPRAPVDPVSFIISSFRVLTHIPITFC